MTVLTLPIHIPTPRFAPNQYMSLKCPKCSHEGVYPISTITRYEEHQIH